MGIPDFKTVEEIEIHFNFKRVGGEKFQLDKSCIPKVLHGLLPYVDYFVSDTQDVREAFCEKVPIEAYRFLIEKVKKLESELINWLADEAKNNKNLTVESLAFSILSEEVDNASGYRVEFKPEISLEKEKKNFERDLKAMEEFMKKFDSKE